MSLENEIQIARKKVIYTYVDFINEFKDLLSTIIWNEIK